MSSAHRRFRTPWLDAPNMHTHAAAEPTPAEEPTEQGRPAWVGIAWFAGALLAAGGLIAGPLGGNANVTAALITGTVLFGITALIATRIAKIDNNPALTSIIIGGFFAKMVGSAFRYHVAANVYGTGDFFDYDKWGRRIAAGLHHGQYIAPPGRFAGTNFVRVMTGFIYAVTPAKLFSGFVVYGWLSFIGVLFFWRAYRIAVSPQRDVRYLTWIVLLPSLAFWPSALGKDAFMVLAMGVTAYGAANLLSQRMPRGLVAIATGMLGMCMVRPHVALVACGGLALAVLVRRSKSVGTRIITVVVVLLAGMLVMQAASSFFGIQTFNRASIQQEISDTSKQTGDGGSQFSPVQVTSPVKFPLAAATVLFRPTPIEAHSFQEMITAIEGTLLAILALVTLRRSITAVRRSRDYPYFAFCLGAIVIFIIAFSGFSNFGLLARQRAVVQPLLLVFLTLPKDMDRWFPRRRDTEAAELEPHVT
jgi:hypothetical protein